MKLSLLSFWWFSFILFSGSEPVVPDSLVNLPADNMAKEWQLSKKPFYHGVASGDPSPTEVVLWTRVTDKTRDTIAVRWAISTQKNMSDPLQVGLYRATKETDFTAKILVKDLQPNTTYYYQFIALGKKSPIGRTKTTPIDAAQVKLAFVSCSNYEAGYYNAFARLAERNDLDAIVHLGDYIYEYEPGRYGDASLDRKHLPAKELITLSDYRIRYSQYRLDPDFQRVHQMHPFITIWDDHEIANNAYQAGAQNHQEDEGTYEERKAAARKAYFEWLPVRDNEQQDIYRKISFGKSVDLIMLDERLAGRVSPVDSVAHPDFKNPQRSMLGAEQLEWFENQLASSEATWKVIGNQVVFSPVDISNLGWGAPVNLDAWDGYPYERQAICDFIFDNQVENVIITAGDTHSSWAFEVPDVANNQTIPIAVEFGTPSITSANSDERMSVEKVLQAEAVLQQKNPHLKFTDLRNHGYLLLELTPQQAVAEWYHVDKINTPSKIENLAKSYSVRSGTNRLYEIRK